MSTDMREAFKKAYNDKRDNYINTLTWKGAKTYTGNREYSQESRLLVDMSQEELQECLNHCNRMLYSSNPKHLGRYKVLEEINEQIQNCNAELFLRYCENNYLIDPNREEIKRNVLWTSLRKLMQQSPDVDDWSVIPITAAASNVPSEFKEVSIAKVLDGCIYCLGTLDKSHLTLTFITKLGFWPTSTEEKTLVGNNKAEKLKYAKQQLRLPEDINLRYNDKGLSFQELKAVIAIPKRQKYSDMTTEQLKVLKNKVLMRLQKTVDNHIYSWKRLIRQLNLVAKYKGYELDDPYGETEDRSTKVASK